MSVPDYGQRAEDHGSILILVKQIGHQLKQKNFNLIFDRISRQEYVRIQEPQMGRQRGIWLRYKKNYHIENNEWGDFQAHRKVLGLICIGQCDTDSEIEQLNQYHESLRKKYGSTLFDSRCAIFGMESPYKASKNNNGLKDSPSINNAKNINAESEKLSPNKLEKLDPKHLENLFTDKIENIEQSSYNTDVGFVDENDENLNEDSSKVEITFTNNKTGSKEDEKSSDNCGSTNAVEEKENNDRPRTSQMLFYRSIDTDYKQVEQDLYEFACSLFWVLESKRLDGRMYDKPNVEKLQFPILCAPCEKKEQIEHDSDSKQSKKRILGRLKKHMGDLSLQASLPIDALGHYTVASELFKATNDLLWLAATFEGLCSASVMLLYPALHHRRISFYRNASYHVGSPPLAHKGRHSFTSMHSVTNGFDKSENKVQSCLTAEGIIEKFNDAVKLYSKFKVAAVIETECSVKAVRVLILQEKYLEASQFLQNMISIGLQISEDEKIERFSVLSDLYKQIGFHRKAAFYKRVAAMRCVAPHNENPNWSRCYHLILQTLNGYKLSLDPKELPKSNNLVGWPGLQVQVLLELVGTARRMGNNTLAVRHMTFLLHAMFEHLSVSDRKEFSSQLETLTSKCEGAPVILALEDTGMIVPPVNLINLPRVKSFKLQNMAPHLRPMKMPRSHQSLQKEVDSGPFIFSPLQMNRDKQSKPSTEMSFMWIEGDVCEVNVHLFNPLPFELKVNPMGLMADGIAFETFPACLSLPPESGPYPVNLLGTPRSNGELQILGYTTHVLGVKSNCRLKDIPSIQNPHYSIQVVPSLPQIQVVTSLPKSATFSSLADSISHVVTSASISLYAGESQECAITLTGSGNGSIEMVKFSLNSNLDRDTESKFFKLDENLFQSQLPIEPHCSASCSLQINAIGDFICHAKPKSKIGSQKNTPTHRSSVPDASSSHKQAHSDVLGSSSEALQMQMIEALLEIQYTGGPGMAADYCRQCAVAVNVEVIPSLVITKWDVLPAETPNQCYLVLDILNTTAHEMEVLYTTIKRILIEAHETCRVPVPIERCPLSKLMNSDRRSAIDICREYVSNLVDLKWSLPAAEVNGTASISNISWTPKMLDSICMSPIHWEYFLNNRYYEPQNEPTFLVGEFINIAIIIYNQSEKPLNTLLLTVLGYQDYQNGNLNYKLEHKRAVIGTDIVSIKQINDKDSFRHEFGLVYFCPGVYKLDIQIGNNIEDGKCPSNPSVRSIADQTNSEHSWKCTPSIELNIIEE